MLDSEKIKKDFEIFNTDQNKDVIYLDNSSTTQMPKCVINEINEYHTKYYSNANRSNYNWAHIVDKKIKQTRKCVASLINAYSPSEVIFTSGATESSNMIACSYGINNLKSLDEILVCFDDHKSTVLPWLNIQALLKKMNINIKLKPILIDTEGDYKEQDLFDKITENTKLVVLTHIHNVYGIEMDVEKIANRVKKINKNVLVVLDASQSIGHIEVDVQKLNVDFMYFSGHKMFADTGIGVLWIKNTVINSLRPYMLGGASSYYLGYNSSLNSNKNLELTSKDFEVGSQNISGILSLKSAIEYIERIGIKNIQDYILFLTRYTYNKLKQIKQIEFLEGIAKCKCAIGYGIISFKIDGFSTSDIGDILADNKIYVRTGSHCTNIKDDSIRISLHIYNTTEDIDVFVQVIKNIINNK